MKRGRDTQQLDLGYPESSLAVGRTAGNRAPDAPLQGAAGQPTRLFNLLHGTHWTLLAYQAPSLAVAPRPGLRIHRIGDRGDIVDADGHFRDAYGLAAGECALVRPDGYIGAVMSASETASLDAYLTSVGLAVRKSMIHSESAHALRQ
jgi:hypothetical protein